MAFNSIYLFNNNIKITKALFSHEFKRLKREEISLVQDNAKLQPNAPDGFFFQGLVFTDMADNLSGKKANLDLSLYERAGRFVADFTLVKNERDRVKQALSIVTRDCFSNQDLRDALPECIIDIALLSHLKRTRPEAFTLDHNRKAYDQYMKLKEKIEFYSTTRLLY